MGCQQLQILLGAIITTGLAALVTPLSESAWRSVIPAGRAEWPRYRADVVVQRAPPPRLRPTASARARPAASAFPASRACAPGGLERRAGRLAWSHTQRQPVVAGARPRRPLLVMHTVAAAVVVLLGEPPPSSHLAAVAAGVRRLALEAAEWRTDAEGPMPSISSPAAADGARRPSQTMPAARAFGPMCRPNQMPSEGLRKAELAAPPRGWSCRNAPATNGGTPLAAHIAAAGAQRPVVARRH